MTQNAFGSMLNTANQLQGLSASKTLQAGQQQAQDAFTAQQAAAQQAAEQKAISDQEIQGLASQYSETNDPAILRQLILRSPEFAKSISDQMGAIDEASKGQLLNDTSAFAQMLQTNPDGAIAYWQENLSQNPTFAGLADNFAAGDVEGALNEVGFGLTALGGMEAYTAVFKGTTQPFAGNAMTAQMGNILLDPTKKGTPEYDLAVSYWTAPEIVNRPDGSTVMVKKTLPASVTQANPALANAIESEADSNLESESASSGVPVGTTDQGLEITPLTEAPPKKITQEQKTYDSEFLGLMNMNDSLSTFRDTLDKLGVQLSLGPLNAVDTQTLKSSYSNAMLAVKEAAELGALTGDDMKIVEQNLPDPTTLSGAFKGKQAAMEGVKIALDVIARKVKNLNSVSKTQGVTVKEFDKPVTPLNAQALQLYKNPPAGYSKKEIDAMFLEQFGRLPNEDELK